MIFSRKTYISSVRFLQLKVLQLPAVSVGAAHLANYLRLHPQLLGSPWKSPLSSINLE